MYLDNVIDISGDRGKNYDFAQVRDFGIKGVIHRATTGTTSMDPLYFRNQENARAAGLLWGAYHVGTLGNGTDQNQNAIDQAKFFFDKTFHNSGAEARETLVALNYMRQGLNGSQKR